MNVLKKIIKMHKIKA